MGTSKAGSPEDTVATLSRLIGQLQDLGFTESALFLAMAKTQLLIELNGVTDAEFRALCDWLDGKHPGTRPGEGGRGRRDGTLRAMRRAWQCPDGVSAGARRRRTAAAV